MPDAGVDWFTHRRFFSDLFAVAVPETVHDLTGGQAFDLLRSLADVRAADPDQPADLVVAQARVPDPSLMDEGGLMIVAQSPPGADSPHVELSNGLTVFAGGDQSWLLSDAVVRWSAGYALTAADDERDYLRGRVHDLEDAIKGQEQRIELLEEQLLAARDEVARLLPLEVSPKAQVNALRRSIPVSIRKRMPRKRQPSATADQSQARSRIADDLRILKGRRLRGLLADYDEAWAGRPVQDYIETGIRRGAAINAKHLDVITPAPAQLPPELQWGDATLHGPDGVVKTAGVAELVSVVSPRLLSIDVWDTLVVRDRPADAAKLATARRMVLQPGAKLEDVFEAMAVRVGVEAQLAADDPMQEYELTDVLRVTAAELGVADEVVAQLVAAEIADEVALSRARDDIAALDHPHRVIASDFYMREDDLADVVRGVAPSFAEVPVYVSVQRRASKRLGGALLDLIRRDFGVTPQDHLHIGDNVHSDVDVQVAAGGHAIHVQRVDRFPGPGEFGRDDLPSCTAQLRSLLDGHDAENPSDDPHRTAGRHAAPVAVALVARGLEEAYRSGADRIHYVSREGLFLAQVHEIVEPILRPPGVPAVVPIHLALSRRATFGASLQAPYRFSLQRMWSMYARQSVTAMLVSIGVDPLDFDEQIAAAGLVADEVLTDARRDPRVEAFLADPQVEEKLSAHVATARDALRRYVESRTTIGTPFIVCDIGWRGTIQDNLVRALGIRSSVGVYLGLFPFLNAQPPNSRKIGVAFDGSIGEEFEYADPPAVLERPWTPDVPSTIGFETVDGTVMPVSEKESGHVSPGIAAFQSGTLEVADIVATWMSGFGLTTQVLRPEIAAWTKDLWCSPTHGLADIWFDSDHDDSFGALNSTTFGKVVPGPDWLDGDLATLVGEGMRASGWPEGYRAWAPVDSLVALARMR
ncbi:MAG: hypothetical protein H6526_01985 [Actinobacteria bacterium]|nr:hypothetical protein [Actinomycetota bacterium]